MKKLDPAKTGTVEKINFPIKKLAQAFGGSLAGYVNIPVEGVYTFTLLSNDGSVLYLNDEMIVDNDGAHSSEKSSGQAALEKDYHAFKLDYFQAGGGKALKAFIEGPGMEYQEIPGEMFKN